MSLRETTLQNRVDALEVALEAMAFAIRTHLPSAVGIVRRTQKTCPFFNEPD
jgi:hypothetical protein